MSLPSIIQSALISVYNKENLAPIVKKLNDLGVAIISTGGTYDFITSLNIPCKKVEDITSYTSILGGRVKTLHPNIFGGILSRRGNLDDQVDLAKYDIRTIDLVIVDLYPFEETRKQTTDESEIIEKVDIGGISLIRAAAKNFRDVVVVPSQEEYEPLLQLLEKKKGTTDIEDRKLFAAKAFAVTSHYDTAIFHYFNESAQLHTFRESIYQSKTLRYGENPHQKGVFYGNLDEFLQQLNGKELSYNNLVDIDAAIDLIKEFYSPAFVIIKHTNACGVATDNNLLAAYEKALAGDPVSAFGGVLACNRKIDISTASKINELFFEILIAPEYDEEALNILKSKRNRILIVQKKEINTSRQFKSILNGVIEQDKDLKTETVSDFKTVTTVSPPDSMLNDLVFAATVCKHLKSNTVVLAKDGQLYGMGCGQTSRVDALKQAIAKAKSFGFDLKGAVMASDAFFPFPDCVQIAYEAGIAGVVQPGGSIKDQDSIDYCNRHKIPMVFTGIRHFKH